ncbi:hypothetical protein Tsubulata_008256 [Turnera subulata]|uniref:Uncharacterized protein n=1 Tax=Turnera subulata TaxID=218843 RepID=A0A9Q0J459_9ROSI|nr:hypothetical protein Tsubulata_008256 [Turnera subulata]
MNYKQRLTQAPMKRRHFLESDARADEAPVNGEEIGVTATLKPHLQVEGVSAYTEISSRRQRHSRCAVSSERDRWSLDGSSYFLASYLTDQT